MRRTKIYSIFFAAFVLVVSQLLPVLEAQTATGSIQGTVVDTSGAVLPGATVKLTNSGTGFSRVVTANDRGDYQAPLMPLGVYEISAEFSGFQTKILRGITLQVEQTAVIRIELAPGQVTETVEVSTTTPLLESQESSLGQVIENKRILELPLNGRNPFQLGLLAGGVTPFRGLSTNLPFTAGGGRHSGNDIMLDGVDDNIRNYNGSTGRNGVNYIPSVDAVQEFKVKTSNFSAEYGRSAGFTVNATIRSGTNQYHGSVFEFLRNDKLDANNFVSNFTGNPKAKFRQNQFGGTFGGPVRLPGYDGRNRTFFFADYQGTQVREAAGSSLSDVAPESFRAGDFSSAGRVIYDPRTRRLGPNGVVTAEPFPNNSIPRNLMDPVALKLQELI
ncbi:MAG: carboxypeptidase regulatory-like domain-containing protein, partial [Bryobacteraceae bacterium]